MDRRRRQFHRRQQEPGATPGQYGSQSQSFTYTPTRRLATASGYYGSLAWLYDANGNRTRETLNGVVSNYAYPATSNRLTSVTPVGGAARAFTYDAAGDIATDTRTGGLGRTFQYDVEGRLSRAFQTNAPAQGGTYGYDALNRLASRTVTSGATTTTTLYVHDTSDHIIAETDTAGVTRREYIWLNDMPVAVVDNVNTASPVVYYVHTDHLGRPARMVAVNWTWVWDVIYSPLGGTAAIFDTTAKLDARFPGQWFQLESGLAYNWHRHYDATLGRYVQPDPIGYSGGRSLYGYVGQNPLAYVDPAGLWRFWWSIYDEARSETIKNYSESDWHNGSGDAFRHCYASCVMTSENSNAEAAILGWLNEKQRDWLDNQEVGERLMDDNNNAVGRACGRKVNSPQECAKACVGNKNLILQYRSGSTGGYSPVSSAW